MSSELENIKQEYASLGEPSGVEQEDDAEHPFDAEKISVSTKPVPLNRLVERIVDKSVSSPKIQRNADLWDDERKSRFIESLMLKIPIPLFYVAADPDENWKVVDGLQRISTIRQFMIDKSFVLSKLEFLTDYNKKNIDTLYYNKNTNDFLVDLISTKEFINSTGNTVKDERMAARELALRFVSFLIRDFNLYPKKGDMDEYLSDTMMLMNAMPKLEKKVINKLFYNRHVDTRCLYTNFDDIKGIFCLGMKRATDLFGIHAFRRSTIHSAIRAPINKAIFECTAITLAKISIDRFNYLLDNKDEIIRYVHQEYQNNNDLHYAISRDSQKHSSVLYRFNWFWNTFEVTNFGG